MTDIEDVSPEIQEVPELSEAPSSPMKCRSESIGYEPTTKEEMRAWFLYDYSISPYFQVYVVGIFPVFMKWLAEGYAARSQGWTDSQLYSCSTSTGADDPATMKLPGIGLTAGSFPVAVAWVTTLMQMIGLLSFSAFGDYGPYRRVMLRRLTWTSCVAITLNVFCVSPDMFWLAGLLRIIAGVCFVLCISLYNSYLPLLMEAYPGPSREDLSERLRLTDVTSMKGNLAGYSGGLSLLIISFVIHALFECDPCGMSPAAQVEATHLNMNHIETTQVQMIEPAHIEYQRDSSQLMQPNICSATNIFIVPALCCAMVGIWWSLLSIYPLLRLPSRPGKPFPTDQGSLLLLGWRDVGKTLRSVLQRRQTFLFLVVYFISSDCLATLVGSAFLIMEENASASTGRWTTMTSMHLNFVLGALSAFLGIFIYAAIQRCFKLSNRQMLLCQFVLMMAVAITCLAGGLRTIGFVPVMAPVSFSIAAMESLIRSIYSNLIPPGQEASMFAFYVITDKGSNLIGAMVTMIIHNLVHSYIPVMWYILAGYTASAAVLYFVDVEQGMKDIGKMDIDKDNEKSAYPEEAVAGSS